MEYLIGIAVGLGLGALGLLFGVSRARRAGAEQARQASEERLRSVVEAIRRGRPPANLPKGSPEAALKQALEEGWSPRAQEREAALHEAIGRVSGFLENSVRAPLTGVDERTGPSELRERIARALGALEDLDFFGREAAQRPEGTDLVALAQKVSHEFVEDQGVGVRLALSEPSVQAAVDPRALMDALYLVLHNAGKFGGGETISLRVDGDGGRARISVRDHGEGFSEEAFRRAFDPFYSTSDEGLGLGLPHARKVVERMGGQIELRNVPDGGAEVELSFPASA